MNNKRIGAAWEKDFCSILAKHGYWVHFIVPDARGSQPFDIIAVKGGYAFAFDCKTSVARSFSIFRLEDNQITAFDKWLRCGNLMPMIVVLYKQKLIVIPYLELKTQGKINLEEIG